LRHHYHTLFKDGEKWEVLKLISFYAKKARGLMARYIYWENRITCASACEEL